MGPPYIERFDVKGYGCIKDASLTLSPLHAIIGPNDSGKSSILRALELTARLTASARVGVGSLNGSSPRVVNLVDFLEFRSLSARVRRAEDAYTEYTFSARFFHHERFLEPIREQLIDGHYDELIKLPTGKERRETGAITEGKTLLVQRQLEQGSVDDEDLMNLAIAQSARVVRFSPDALRRDSPLLVGNGEAQLLSESGFGLPAVYDNIVNRQDGSMSEVVNVVRQWFPAVKMVRLRAETAGTKSLEVELTNGTKVPAKFLSEGLLYCLAFVALFHLEPTTILLIEEPENGLHPARIADVVRVLRELSKATQIVIATHSPLVINELKGHEVSVVTRTEAEGTKVTLLRDTPNFEERSEVYALGELWVSYANGTDERALLKGERRK